MKTELHTVERNVAGMGDFNRCRVDGGWLYILRDMRKGEPVAMSFVPDSFMTSIRSEGAGLTSLPRHSVGEEIGGPEPLCADPKHTHKPGTTVEQCQAKLRRASELLGREFPGVRASEQDDDRDDDIEDLISAANLFLQACTRPHATEATDQWMTRRAALEIAAKSAAGHAVRRACVEEDHKPNCEPDDCSVACIEEDIAAGIERASKNYPEGIPMRPLTDADVARTDALADSPIEVGVLPSSISCVTTRDTSDIRLVDCDRSGIVVAALPETPISVRSQTIGREIAHRYNQHHALLDALEELLQSVGMLMIETRHDAVTDCTEGRKKLRADIIAKSKTAREVLNEAQS